MQEPVDALIVHGHLLTMQGAGVGYVADGALAIRGGRIAAVGATNELAARYQAAEVIDAAGCAVLPGLVDAHMHTPWAVVRGVALTLDAEAIRAEAQTAAQAVADQVAADPLHREMVLLAAMDAGQL